VSDPPIYRNIKRTALFDEQVGDVIPDIRRADEFLEAAEWLYHATSE
jgi:hypothetical protein